MRFLATLVGLIAVGSLCEAALVQRRTYRNTEEILVPVTIIQDGEEIKEPPSLKENEKESGVMAGNIAAAVEEEKKLEALEAVVEAERRIDEAIVEEEIKEAVKEEQTKKVVEVLEKEKQLGTRIGETEQSQSNQAVQEPVKEAYQNEIVAVAEGEQTSDNVVATQDDPKKEISASEAAAQPEDSLRQATQATPTATSTQQTFIQFLQSSPLGQLFNQQNGTNPSPFPALPTFPTLPTLPPLPAFNNPFATAQSFFNNATQGFQQFTSNIQSSFPFGGQQQNPSSNNASTARPPGPIQQFLSNFGQPNPTQQGPFQGFISFFQGNNRIQEPSPAPTPSPETQPAREPEIQEQTPEDASVEVSNNYAEENDSFEESVQPSELIVVNGDASEVESNQPQGYPSVPY